MKIYTKKGDQGETFLFRGGKVSKDSVRVSAYGEVDELNSVIGFARASKIDSRIDIVLKRVQSDLFTMGADLATPDEAVKEGDFVLRIGDGSHKFIEENIDYFDSQLPPLKEFILPGGTKPASILHFGRTVCRRAERAVVALNNTDSVNPAVIIYLNRLSDLLFVLARYQNKSAGTSDSIWKNEEIG